MLPGRCLDRQSRLFEFKLSGRPNGHRPEQFLLQQHSSLHWLGRCAGLLQRTSRQRQVPAAEQAADHLPARFALLRQRLRAGRQFVLPRNQDDVDGHVLSQRPGAERTKQGAMQAAHSHSDRATVLRSGPHSNHRRKMLRFGERNERRRMLRRCSERDRPFALPGLDPDDTGLCAWIHTDAGRQLLQQPFHQRRRHVVHQPAAGLCQRRIPRFKRRLHAGWIAAVAMRAGPRSRRQRQLRRRRWSDAACHRTGRAAPPECATAAADKTAKRTAAARSFAT
jgi:hypothetical protein